MKHLLTLTTYLLTIFFSNILGAVPTYTIKDYIGKQWNSHIVQYNLSKKDSRKLSDGYILINQFGEEIPFQTDRNNQISFIASIGAFSTNTYTFRKGKSSLKSGMYFRDGKEFLEAGNGVFKIRLRKRLSNGKGPLAGWLTQSGKWVGDSEIESKEEIESYNAGVIQHGPVQTIIRCEIVFGNGGKYSQTYTIPASDPLVIIKEECKAEDNTGLFKLIFSDNYQSDFLLHRLGSVPFQITEKAINSTKVETLYYLEPWLHWNFSAKRGIGFDLVSSSTDDSIFFLASNPTIWVDPSISEDQRVSSLLKLEQNTTNIYIEADIKKGRREYILGTLSLSSMIADIRGSEQTVSDRDPQINREDRSKRTSLLKGIDAKRLRRGLPSQQFQLKYSDFPLNKVKDFILEWPEMPQSYPRFILTKDQITRFKALNNPSERLVKTAINRCKAGNLSPENDIPLYISTENIELADAIAGVIENRLQNLINWLTDGTIASVGVAPHNYIAGISGSLNILDVIYPTLDEHKKKRIRAQLAFLGYMVNSPAYWDSRRGFDAMFINMHTTVHKTQANIASMINDHPMSAEWMTNATDFLIDKLLMSWADEDGRWTGKNVEAPHYAMGSFDDLLATLLIARNTGMNNLIDTREMKQMGEFFAKISTPPDSRVKGWRHLPPIGNTYKFEPTGIFAVLASVYEKSDPEFASQMQWMQYEHGNPQNSVVGGYLAGFSGYRHILKTLTVDSKAPEYRSEHLRDAGVILRSSYNTPDESMLYLIAGEGATPRRHYDRDQGAITIWGKGEIISDDFGYNGCAPEEEQSMISSSKSRGIMNIEEFKTGTNLDYVKGIKGNWARQILLVKKGELQNNPEYFVINDFFQEASDATWRMWLTGKEDNNGSLTTGQIGDSNIYTDTSPSPINTTYPSLLLGEKKAILNGVEKNNTDIIFAALPSDGKIKTAIKTKTPYGVNSQGRFCKTTTSQIGIIIESKSFKSLLTLVFPRDKKMPAPKVTAIADNNGFKIEHTNGTDYIFLSADEFTWEGDGIEFSGSVASVQMNNNEAILSLSGKGKISYRGETLISSGENITATIK